MTTLKREQVMDSFSAVGSFLQAKNYNPIIRHEIVCKICVDYPVPFNDTIEFECKDYLNNESYILYSDTFKANNYHRPVWSAYNLFTWDEKTNELKVELENKKYTIKHTL
jgi:hypothetical protein